MSVGNLFKRSDSGDPILFNVTRIPNRAKIISMISQGGGELANEPDQNVISVVEFSKISDNTDDFCSPEFIEYCFEEGVPFEKALADPNTKNIGAKPRYSSSQESKLQQSPLRNGETIQSQLLYSQSTVSSTKGKKETGQLKGKFTVEQDKVLLEEYEKLSTTIKDSVEIYAALSTQTFNGYFSPETVQCRHELLIDLQDPTANQIDAYFSCSENDRKKINEPIPLLSQPSKDNSIPLCVPSDSDDDAFIDGALSKWDQQHRESAETISIDKQKPSDVNLMQECKEAKLLQNNATQAETPSLSDSARASYKQAIMNLMTEFKLPAEVVFWSLHIHSGNIEAAKFFLTTKNYSLSGAWMREDDYNLMQDLANPLPVAGRSAEECEKRRNFLNAYKNN